jgi:hypothetical protein
VHSGSTKLQVHSYVLLFQVSDPGSFCIECNRSFAYNSIRKDGSSFRDLLHVSPIRDASGKVCFHFLRSFLKEVHLFCI